MIKYFLAAISGLAFGYFAADYVGQQNAGDSQVIRFDLTTLESQKIAKTPQVTPQRSVELAQETVQEAVVESKMVTQEVMVKPKKTASRPAIVKPVKEKVVAVAEQLPNKTVKRAAPPAYIKRGSFYLRENNRKITPRGFNYIRLDPKGGGHATFSPFIYDKQRYIAALDDMQKNKFNIVRVFINGSWGKRGCMYKSHGALEPDPAYLDNMVEFIMLAKERDIMIVPCIFYFPYGKRYCSNLKQVENIESSNRDYLNQAYIDAKKQYLRDLINDLHDRNPEVLSNIFCWDLHNELCFKLGHPPFSLEEGTVTVANGKTYDMATDKEQLADDMTIYWINQMVKTIRNEIPKALVSADIFTYAAVGRKGPGDIRQKKARWQNRYPFNPIVMLRSEIDIIDIHYYPESASNLQHEFDSLKYDEFMKKLKSKPNKAYIVGEVGIFKKKYPKLSDAKKWVAEVMKSLRKAGAAGWIYWTYDTDEQELIWNAKHERSDILKKIKYVR